MSFKMKYTINKKYLTKGTKRRSGILMPYVGFIVSHDTGNSGSTALGNIGYYENTNNQMSASAHAFIDDKGIWECVPATTGSPEKSWHVLYDIPDDNIIYGDDANDIAIGVELCFGGKINNKEAYKRYVWYHAYLCYKFDLDPKRHVIGHNELDPNRKTDPFKNALKIMGINKDKFLQDIADELRECTGNYVESEDDAPMKLAQWEKDVVINGVKKWSKIEVNGSPVINSPDVWIAKVENGSLTAGDLSILNFAIINRVVDVK